MPLYDYTCPACQTAATKLVAIAKRDEQTCDCGASLVRSEIAGAVTAFVDHAYKPAIVFGNGARIEGTKGNSRGLRWH